MMLAKRVLTMVCSDIGDGGYGQNIARGAQTNYELTDGQAIARAITHQWYNDEFEIYPAWGVEPSDEKFDEWGHLTQIVWKQTKKVGCAIARCPIGEMDGYFAVCNYDPPGKFALPRAATEDRVANPRRRQREGQVRAERAPAHPPRPGPPCLKGVSRSAAAWAANTGGPFVGIYK